MSGLDYLHQKGIFHKVCYNAISYLTITSTCMQNLDGDNILVEMQGQCKISDFSVSKVTDSLAGENLQGHIYWMPPEVVKRPKGIDNAKVDIWSVGCIVLAMWTGMRPWAGEETVAVMFKVSLFGLKFCLLLMICL